MNRPQDSSEGPAAGIAASIQPPHPLLALDDPRACDRARAGGKAAALARLAALGLPVPPGIVLPPEVPWDDALEAALRQAAQALLAAPANGGHGASPTAPFSADPAALAVRSSVCCEDGAEASFAGQFSTVLDVRDARGALEAVRTVQASFSAQRAIEYAARMQADPGRKEERVRDPAAAMAGAVLLQRQIPALWAGVCFSADPESGIEQLSVVEGVPGLGEALVSGRAEPSYARVDRRSGRVVETRGIPEDFLALAKSVVGLCERVRAKLGGAPVDIEWAYDGQQLWLLQARPITTPTFPLPERRPLSEPEVWFHGNFAETMPGPVPRLAWDAIRQCVPFSVWPVDIRVWAQQARTEPVECLAGRVCWNVSYHAHAGFLNRHALALWKLIDARMVAAIERMATKGEIVPTGEWSAYQRGRLLFVALSVNAKLLWRMRRALRNGAAAIAAMGAAWQRLDAAQGPGSSADQTPQEAWRRARALLDGFFPAIEPHLGTFYLLFLPPLWSALAARWSGRTFADAASDLGAMPSFTARMERALRQLGLDLRALGVASACPPEALPAEAREALARFLNAFGHRGPGEQDLSVPRLSERPELAVELALRSVEATQGPRQGSAEEPDRRAERLIDVVKARGWCGPLRAAVLRRLLPHARRMAPVREDGKHLFWMPFMQRLRELFLRVGAGLQERGVLESREDIFHFTVEELETLLPSAFASAGAGAGQAGLELRARVERRRRELERWRRLAFPDVLRSDGVPVTYAPQAMESGAQGEAGAQPHKSWTGVPVSSGIFEGPARVARTFEEARALEPGEVLVTVSVDPGWTPLYPRAGALVMEVGGVLSHGAVVARELGLPAVAGLHGAATLFRTGQRLRVDGRLGRVTVVEEGTQGEEANRSLEQLPAPRS